MGALEVAKRFIKSSSLAERAALNICERLPRSLWYGIFCGPTFFRWLSFLEESEYWDKDRFRNYQFEQTRDLLSHAMNNVPYYRKLFSDIGFRPEKMQSLDDLGSLPYLSKETVRDNPGEFVDEQRHLHFLEKKRTSGSTGIPMTVYESRETHAAFHAFRARLLDRVGYTLDSKEVMLWAFIEIGKRKNLPSLRYGNKLIFSIRYLTGEWLSHYCNMMRKFEPEFVSGYPSALSILSSFMKNNHLSLFKRLRAVISYAETLYDWQRELIEEAFGARVFSMYAMTESAALGGECEHSTDIHTYPQYGLTELTESAGGHREIIATGFTNDVMPFIRYRTGDLVSGFDESCTKCGRSHKTCKAIEGRVQDFLVGRNGELIPRLMPWIKAFPHVLQLQFSQEEPGRAMLKIVRGNGYTDRDTHSIRERLDEMLGVLSTQIAIEIVFVDHIPPAASGKVKMVDQKLDARKLLGV
jgi:phenylacetate-CoA ligase